jgi:hypothetical protein
MVVPVIRQSCSALAALVWFIAGPANYAQSLDPHKPAPLGPGVNKGNVDGGTGSHYYYFLAGPGHVKVQMAFKEMGIFGNPRQEVLTFDFYNESGKLMSHNAVVSFDRLERIETGGDFGSRQKIVLAIVPQRGLVRLGGYYEVEVTGAVTFDRGTAVGLDVKPIDTRLVRPGSTELVHPGGPLVRPGAKSAPPGGRLELRLRATDGSTTPTPVPAQSTPAPKELVEPAAATTIERSSRDTLPAFFPPKANETADLRLALNIICAGYKAVYGKGPTMKQLDGNLTWVLEGKNAAYPALSHYWLAGNDNPGFAIVTHLELIDDLGEPVPNHRFDYSLPAPDWYTGWQFLKALFVPSNGRYRLIALIVSKNGLKEKADKMKHEDIVEINHGPSALADNDWASMEVTPDFVFTAYIYEFSRKSREDEISASNTAMGALLHLSTIHFFDAIEDTMKMLPHPSP